MDALRWFVLGSVLASGATMGVLVWAVRSFGSYTERNERASQLTRQSNEMTRQSNNRTTDEVRTNTEIVTQAHERNLEILNAFHEQRSA